jgi:hypothetical protein
MPTHLLATTLVRGDHVRSFEVRPARREQWFGWEASERQDQRLVQQQRFSDWHRVERAINRFIAEISALRQQGWLEP